MTEIITRKEKISYGLGDMASHIGLDNVIIFLTFYYTDVVGLPAAFVGTMFLLARTADAIIDPAMGYIADRTRTRWGKFRPLDAVAGAALWRKLSADLRRAGVPRSAR